MARIATTVLHAGRRSALHSHTTAATVPTAMPTTTEGSAVIAGRPGEQLPPAIQPLPRRRQVV